MSADGDKLKEKFQQSLRRQHVERPKGASRSFHRGEVVNYNPHQADFFKDDFLKNYLLKGWTPASPPIAPGTKVTAFGSCFAANITRHLSKIGFDTSKDRDPDIYISRIGDGLVNVHALSGQFEWALENKEPPAGLWQGYDAADYGFDESVRLRTRDLFLATEFFIVTLGLSEIWYDEPTGGVFWRAVPARKFDAGRHKFRVSSFAESKQHVALMYRLIREHVPNAKVLFTLSPIPLAATFRPVSCLTANAVSKAILRAALDEFVRENEADLNTRLFYFPSYEFVNELFPARFRADNRHPHDVIIHAIMKTFEAVYCDNDYTLKDAEALFREVRAFSMSELAHFAAEEAEEEDAEDGKKTNTKPVLVESRKGLARVLSRLGFKRG